MVLLRAYRAKYVWFCDYIIFVFNAYENRLLQVFEELAYEGDLPFLDGESNPFRPVVSPTKGQQHHEEKPQPASGSRKTKKPPRIAGDEDSGPDFSEGEDGGRKKKGTNSVCISFSIEISDWHVCRQKRHRCEERKSEGGHRGVIISYLNFVFFVFFVFLCFLYFLSLFLYKIEILLNLELK